MRDRPAPLVLLATPSDEAPFGSHRAVAADGQRLLAADLSRRLGRLGAATLPLRSGPRSGAFHWGRWFVAAARDALARHPSLDAIGYAGGGALPLLPDPALDDLLSPVHGEVVANNRFSADAFVFAGDRATLDRGLGALAACDSDNGAPRALENAGFRSRDLGAAPFSRFDVDTTVDLALLRLATRLPETRDLGVTVSAFLEMARLPRNVPLTLPRFERLADVIRSRDGELVVAGRVPGTVWQHLETETACRVRCLVEERGMRSARHTAPRSILASLMARSSPSELIAELATLGDAVVLDTRVLMASVSRSPDTATWPPDEERFASDFLDAAAIETPWLRELTGAARDASIPFVLGGHALVSDGLRVVVGAAWLGH